MDNKQVNECRAMMNSGHQIIFVEVVDLTNMAGQMREWPHQTSRERTPNRPTDQPINQPTNQQTNRPTDNCKLTLTFWQPVRLFAQ